MDRDRVLSRLVVVLVIVSVLMAIGMAYLYFQPTPKITPSPVGVIGVIDIDRAILESDDSSLLSAAVDEALRDSKVKAVVLRIDSPGGAAHLVEQVYMDILRLSESKPVVASISMALSGGYYIAVGADVLYANPSSMVGNVGVVGSPPGFLVPSEETYETGPEKATGFKPDLFAFNLSHALDNFASAVVEGRGERLRVGQTELRRGTIYLGSEAMELGLVDGLGSLQDAADRAAQEAGVSTYSMRNMIKEALEAKDSSYYAEELGRGNLTMRALNELYPPPAIYYLYLPNALLVQDEGIPVGDGNVTAPRGVGQVVVDLSHGNRITPWGLELLSSELAKRGVFVGFASDWETVEGSLEKASCLIIAAPTMYYSYDEYRVIRDFVNSGRLLILFYDPAVEFNEIPALNGPINSLANHYGLSFGKGYLYNMEDNYGFYRNIVVRTYEDTPLTSDLGTTIFFTATYLHPTDADVAYVAPGTYGSISGRSLTYSTVSYLDKGNGTVVAFGDITWLLEPFVYTEDNYGLALNLVGVIEDTTEALEED